MERIGWIGAGIMGKPMARNLMKAGYEVHVYARHPEKVADIVEEGASFHAAIADCGRRHHDGGIPGGRGGCVLHARKHHGQRGGRQGAH